MLTLDDTLQLPTHVSFPYIDEAAILLNMHTNQYFLLDEVGRRLWGLVREGKSLRESYQMLLAEFEVEPAALEQDVLELMEKLKEQRLVEIVLA